MLSRQEAAACAPDTPPMRHGAPSDKSLYHRTTLHRVGDPDQVTAAGSETHSRGIIISTARSSFEKAARGVGPSGAASKCPGVHGARKTIHRSGDLTKTTSFANDETSCPGRFREAGQLSE